MQSKFFLPTKILPMSVASTCNKPFAASYLHFRATQWTLNSHSILKWIVILVFLLFFSGMYKQMINWKTVIRFLITIVNLFLKQKFDGFGGWTDIARDIKRSYEEDSISIESNRNVCRQNK
jgi:hypothetical protein